MRSVTAYTEEIDDLEMAVAELVSQIEDFPLSDNSIGILYTDEDIDYPELYKLITDKWSIPFVGATTLAMFTGAGGIDMTGIALLIMTDNEVEFTIGMTDTITVDNYKEEIMKTYKVLSEEAGHKEEVLLTYTFKGSVLGGDNVIAAIESCNKNVAIFGGIASDSFSFDKCRVFCNDRESRSAIVMVLISGNIRPRFVTVKSIANKANISYEVTESKGNKVYKLGRKTFLEGLEKAGRGTDKTDVNIDFVLSPFIATLKREGGDRIEVARALAMIDQKSGAGVFLGEVPEGSSLEIGLINDEDVKCSVEEVFTRIFSTEEQSDYDYSTLLCISCAARYMALAGNTNAEVEAYINRLPERLSLIGMYSYGEYCPTKGIKNREYNIFHNETFTIMIL